MLKSWRADESNRFFWVSTKKKKSKNLIRLSINMYDLIKMDKLRGGYPWNILRKK
jgi:hypothetical protein